MTAYEIISYIEGLQDYLYNYGRLHTVEEVQNIENEIYEFKNKTFGYNNNLTVRSK